MYSNQGREHVGQRQSSRHRIHVYSNTEYLVDSIKRRIDENPTQLDFSQSRQLVRLDRNSQ
jgi:hypothetical protein